MNCRTLKGALVIAIVGLGAVLVGAPRDVRAQKDQSSGAMPPASRIPTFSTENLGREGFFYVGGQYTGTAGKEVMHGAMYVEVMVPNQIRQKYPIVFFHGNGQSGTVWRQTPDGRPGWAYYLISQGYVVYMVDYPARGRSPYVPDVDGKLGIRTALDLEQIWTAPVPSGGDFPRKKLYTQWPSDSPKKGQMGDPVFDNFIKGQMQFVSGQAELAVPAGVALLDQIGSPVILITHSQGGGIGFNVADQRPKLVTGKIGNAWGITNMPMHYEPPVNNPEDLKTFLEEKSERPDEVPCYMQKEPVHKLAGMQNIRILSISAEGTYHRTFDVCIPKWLNQAGVKDEFVRLEDVGIHGNMHEMFLDRNSDAVIKFIDDWIRKTVK